VTSAPYRIALVTCSELRELEDDDRLVIEPLARRGITAVPAVWDDPEVDWSAWDYQHRRDEFVTWAASVPKLLNPAPVVEWNTDKRYLRELAGVGVPVVETAWVEPGDEWAPPADGVYVIKPAISAGSRDTGKYGPQDADHALAHVRRLQAAGRLIMIQPYLPAVDTYGETALLHFTDSATGKLAFSHAIRKGPMLTGPDLGVEGLYVPELITPREPTAAELDVARQVIAAAPEGLLYARVDLIPDLDGTPRLVELELTEPSLFFAHGEGAAERFADAVAAALR
jgi:hypothetical protein